MNFEDELDERPSGAAPEREISLGMGTILAMFFGLVLICAAFFGFGYSMGHRATVATSASSPETDPTGKTEKADSTFSDFKPATPVTTPKASSAPSNTSTQADEASSSDAGGDGSTSSTAPVSTVPPAVSVEGTWMVQVSATTRKPDAEALTKVLVGKGFAAIIKPEQDQKFHVRVGPFDSKKDADTTRKLLIASGYKDPFLTPR